MLKPDDKLAARGTLATPNDTARAGGAMDGFDLLTTLLVSISSIYTSHEVCPRSPNGLCVFAHALLQDTGPARNEIEALGSQITQLGTLFATPPSDVVEVRRRSELIRYDTIPSPVAQH